MNRRVQRGFSLIELMIGLVAGIIVVGAVSSFAVSTLRTSSQNIQSTRLTQDLRTAMTLVTRELRRAGYDAGSVSQLGTGKSLSGFTTLQAPPFGPDGCLSYEYNRAGNQFRAIRANAGALEMATATAVISNCANGAWSALTDTDVVTITRFEPDEVREPFSSIVQSRVVGTDTEVMTGCGVVRKISIGLTGSLATDASVARTIHDEVRVRADPVRFTTETLTGVSDEFKEVPSEEQTCDLQVACLKAYGLDEAQSKPLISECE